MRIDSSFEGGSGYEDKCLSYSAKLPQIFGPGIWWTLHTTASTYPTNPDPETFKGCVAFVNSVPSMLPCKQCKEHLREELSKRDVHAACSNAEDLSQMWCSIHNVVNKRNGKPLMDCNTIHEEYATVPVCGLPKSITP